MAMRLLPPPPRRPQAMAQSPLHIQRLWVWARLAVLSGRIRRDLDEILPDQGKLVHGWAARKVSGKSAGRGKAKRSVAEPFWLAGSRNLSYVKASF